MGQACLVVRAFINSPYCEGVALRAKPGDDAIGAARDIGRNASRLWMFEI